MVTVEQMRPETFRKRMKKQRLAPLFSVMLKSG